MGPSNAPAYGLRPSRAKPALPATALAEREGFEPSIQLWAVYWFSKPAPSASRPPLPTCFIPYVSIGGSAGGAEASRSMGEGRQGARAQLMHRIGHGSTHRRL